MSLRGEVLDSLNSLCEGAGVREGDIAVHLVEAPSWIRVHESPGAASLYREVADEASGTIPLMEGLHECIDRSIVLRWPPHA